MSEATVELATMCVIPESIIAPTMAVLPPAYAYCILTSVS